MSRALLALGLLLAAFLPTTTVPLSTVPVVAAAPASLSLDGRVACQAAIEEVSWQHRAWPETNPDPKPPLSAVLPPPATIRAKVEDSLRQSAALERLWAQPLTPAQLQAELDRMAARSQQPQVLAELFAALGNDPYRAAECLARPALADRLLRSWFASDDRWQGEVRARAAAALATHPSVERLPTLGGEYSVVEWIREEGATAPASPELVGGPAEIRLDAEEWTDLVARLATGLSPLPKSAPAAAPLDRLPSPRVTDASALPVGVVGRLQEEPERLYLQAVLAREEGRLRVATVSWAKAGFEAWWAGAASDLPADVADPGERYVLPALAAACTDDTWPASPGLNSAVPDARFYHSAVWTGSEMIVWGGGGSGGLLPSGGVYCAPGNRLWYFAEGYTGSGFDEYLTLQNPGTFPAQVSVTYLRTGLGPLTKGYTVPATSRTTLKVNDEVGPNQAVSIQVLSDLPIVAERPMYFKYGAGGWTGGHNVVGATAPKSTWYFAEGYTGAGFDEYLTVQNPNSSAATVTVTYYLGSGGPVVRSYPVGATRRVTVSVNGEVGPNQAVSMKVESTLPIVAERPMYFSYGPGWTGGHDVLGYAP